MIKHVSFDLWLTLIKSNPEFKFKRNQVLFEQYNPQNLTLEEVSLKVKEIDRLVDKSNEMLGNSLPSLQIYSLILASLGNKEYNEDHIYGLKEHFNSLFIENHPVLYDENTHLVLSLLKDSGISLSVLSNTGFIEGDVLEIVLEKLGINKVFDFKLFSDEYDISKPNIEFFKVMLNNIKRRKSSIQPNNILHVGDNVFADSGGMSLGIKTEIINSNSKSIRDIYEYVKNYNKTNLLVTQDSR